MSNIVDEIKGFIERNKGLANVSYLDRNRNDYDFGKINAFEMVAQFIALKEQNQNTYIDHREASLPTRKLPELPELMDLEAGLKAMEGMDETETMIATAVLSIGAVVNPIITYLKALEGRG